MTEAQLQYQVCRWIRLQYPDVIFTSEASGQRLTIGQAKKAKMLRSGNKLPDLIILEPRGPYYGLCIELKVKSPWTRIGALKSDKHLAGQAEILKRLFRKGYLSTFAVGFESAKRIIDNYMSL